MQEYEELRPGLMLDDETRFIRRRTRGHHATAAGGLALSEAMLPPDSEQPPVITFALAESELPFHPRRIRFAAYWAAACGKNPTDVASIRWAMRKSTSTADIKKVILSEFQNDLPRHFGHIAAEVESGQTLQWPTELTMTRPGRRNRPKTVRMPKNVALLPIRITPYSEKAPLYFLPPTWGDVSEWYRNTYRLEHRIAEHLPAEYATPEHAPLDDWKDYWSSGTKGWGGYWIPELAGPAGPRLREDVVNLAGIPHIDDREDLEGALDREPYLCLMPEQRYIRNGNEAADAHTYLTKAEVALLNLLILSQLRSGRAVSFERLQIRSGDNAVKTQRNLDSLIQKVNPPMSNKRRVPRTIIPTSKNHYAINDETIVVDARQPVSTRDD